MGHHGPTWAKTASSRYRYTDTSAEASRDGPDVLTRSGVGVESGRVSGQPLEFAVSLIYCQRLSALACRLQAEDGNLRQIARSTGDCDAGCRIPGAVTFLISVRPDV